MPSPLPNGESSKAVDAAVQPAVSSLPKLGLDRSLSRLAVCAKPLRIDSVVLHSIQDRLYIVYRTVYDGVSSIFRSCSRCRSTIAVIYIVYGGGSIHYYYYYY